MPRATTGTTSHGTFVGQASGDDPGVDVEAPAGTMPVT